MKKIRKIWILDLWL